MSSNFDAGQELSEINIKLGVIENKLIHTQLKEQIDQLNSEREYLIKKEFLLLEIKLVQEYGKLSNEIIPIMKQQLLSPLSPLSPVHDQNHSLLASLINSEDAGRGIKRNNTINYFSKYTKPFSPSTISISSLASTNLLSQTSDLDLSSHSSLSLSDITSLNDRLEKEASGLKIKGISDEMKEQDDGDDTDDCPSLLKSITGKSDTDNEIMWQFEI